MVGLGLKGEKSGERNVFRRMLDYHSEQWLQSPDLLMSKVKSIVGLNSAGGQHTLQPFFQTFVCIK